MFFKHCFVFFSFYFFISKKAELFSFLFKKNSSTEIVYNTVSLYEFFNILKQSLKTCSVLNFVVIVGKILKQQVAVFTKSIFHVFVRCLW